MPLYWGYASEDVVIPDGIPAIVPLDLFKRVQEKPTKTEKLPQEPGQRKTICCPPKYSAVIAEHLRTANAAVSLHNSAGTSFRNCLLFLDFFTTLLWPEGGGTCSLRIMLQALQEILRILPVILPFQVGKHTNPYSCRAAPANY